ncbi:hypothetical protein LIER_11504 [Lithospermum erythrorhizon]|uniref:Reverse transcriptase n=1 Tax=Lithospermum erythrorhizon TaxID=34254 RepID=A0AAV3PQ31_LITER
MNHQLTRVITSEEVKNTVFDMPADKSLGPDEGLTCMIREAEVRKALTGDEVMKILQDYEKTSSQKVNLGKCSVSFSPRVPGVLRRCILMGLGMCEVKDQGLYLGLPSQVGRTKNEVFHYISGKVDARVKGWKGKLLSQARKKVMVKSITLAISNFVMNCFKLPLGIIDDLNSTKEKFFWSKGDGKEGKQAWPWRLKRHLYYSSYLRGNILGDLLFYMKNWVPILLMGGVAYSKVGKCLKKELVGGYGTGEASTFGRSLGFLEQRTSMSEGQGGWNI